MPENTADLWSTTKYSLVERARKRYVIPSGFNEWTVFGDRQLGDMHECYTVRLEGDRYVCSCYMHQYGNVRQKTLCSHVLAVMLFRGAKGSLPIPSPRHSMFGLPPLLKFKAFRPHQWEAIQAVVKAFQENPACKVVFLDAPTGSGKTLIAEVVRRLLQVRGIYICTTKTLQEQFMRDFPYAKLLKGRQNYPTLDYPDRFADPVQPLSAAECLKVRDEVTDTWVCPWCSDPEQCPYEVAKREALHAELSVLNTSYFLTEANGPGRFGNVDFAILDEGDKLEQALMAYVEVHISARLRERLGIGVPARKTVADAWVDWLENQAKPAVKDALKTATEQLERFNVPPVPLVRWQKQLERLQGTLARCDLRNGTWVYTGYSEAENAPVIFRPVRVNEMAPSLLWKHAKRFLVMSATIIDPASYADDLGLEPGTWQAVSVANTFPAERRPIYVIPRADMTTKNRDQAWPEVAQAVADIMAAYPDDRILVHTVSYDLTRYLISQLPKQRLFYYQNPDERSFVLEQFRQTPGGVLLAPSLDRGIDLPGDDCRVVVVAKVPFPDLGDKQIAARLYSKGGNHWYRVQTVRTLCQMTGRGMRSEDDQCDIYILDKQFVSNVWAKSRRLLPEWWREALVWTGSPKLNGR